MADGNQCRIALEHCPDIGALAIVPVKARRFGNVCPIAPAKPCTCSIEFMRCGQVHYLKGLAPETGLRLIGGRAVISESHSFRLSSAHRLHQSGRAIRLAILAIPEFREGQENSSSPALTGIMGALILRAKPNRAIDPYVANRRATLLVTSQALPARPDSPNCESFPNARPFRDASGKADCAMPYRANIGGALAYRKERATARQAVRIGSLINVLKIGAKGAPLVRDSAQVARQAGKREATGRPYSHATKD